MAVSWRNRAVSLYKLAISIVPLFRSGPFNYMHHLQRNSVLTSMVARTKTWLEKQNPSDQQELVFQLLGMQWCGSRAELKTRVAQETVFDAACRWGVGLN
ncbi:MAG: hypothetical protein WDM78_16570 [Puia sp.]